MVKDYANTKIYYIPVGEDRYYGHTTHSLSQRKGQHITSLRTSNRKVYVAIRKTNIPIELIWVEDFSCNSLVEAKERERYWIEQFGTLNSNIPNRTNKEWARDYREKHKDEIALKNQQYIQEYNEAYARNLERRRPFAEKDRQDMIVLLKMAEESREKRKKERERLIQEYMEKQEKIKQKQKEYQKTYRARKKAEKETSINNTLVSV
jgi:hypothetical protein